MAVPPLLSNQAANSSAFPFPSHSTVLLDASVTICGGVVSSIVKIAVVEFLFPHSSRTVNVTTTFPVAPQSSLRASKLCFQKTFPQLSVALAPPWFSTQAFNSDRFPLPSHSTVNGFALDAITGDMLSSMVNVALVETVFPQSSVAVNITVAAPVAPQRLLSSSKSLLHAISPNSVLAIAPPLFSNHEVQPLHPFARRFSGAVFVFQRRTVPSTLPLTIR